MTSHLHQAWPNTQSDNARDQFYRHVGQQICLAREAAEMTQRELSLASGIAQGNLCEIENGNRYRISCWNVSRIALPLRRTMDELCQVTPPVDLRKPRIHMLLQDVARMAESAEILLVDFASELARLMPREA